MSPSSHCLFCNNGTDSLPSTSVWCVLWCWLYCSAAVKFRGTAAQTNFSMTNYGAELEMQHKASRQLQAPLFQHELGCDYGCPADLRQPPVMPSDCKSQRNLLQTATITSCVARQLHQIQRPCVDVLSLLCYRSVVMSWWHCCAASPGAQPSPQAASVG